MLCAYRRRSKYHIGRLSALTLKANANFLSRSSQMNWDQMQGKWMQVKGSVKEKFGKLTDDDLKTIEGNRDKFIGKLQERYGYAKEEAQKRADEWARALSDMGAQSGAPRTQT